MFADSDITAAVARVRNSLEASLVSKHGDNRDWTPVVDKIMDIHGMSEEHFNFIGRTEDLLMSNVNDVSVDTNANKNEKTIAGTMVEVALPINKVVGYRYLYRTMKDLYGKEEADRLAGEMYDMSLALSDSSKILSPYCFSLDTSKLVMNGRDWGTVPSAPPKRLTSYIAALNETLHQISNHTAGALAAGSFFMDAAHILMYREGYTLEDLKDPEKRKYVENCFQSFVHSMNHLSRNSTECVPITTEVLTPTGFKRYDELDVGDDIYTWKDGTMEVQQVQRVNIGEFDGELHRYANQSYEALVTPNHKMLRRKFNSTEFELKPSSEIFDHKAVETFPTAFQDVVRDDYDIDDTMIELLAIILTDGSISSNGMTITKAINRVNSNEKIVRCLDACGIEYRRYESWSEFGVRSTGDLYGTYKYFINTTNAADIIQLLSGTRDSIPEFVYQFSKRQARLFLATWMEFDGYGSLEFDTHDTRLQCDSMSIAEQLQHVAVLACYTNTIRIRQDVGIDQPTIYVVLHRTSVKSVRDRSLVPYKGLVWCPTTKNGTVVFRANGRVFIHGNSPFTNISVFDRVKIQTFLEPDNMGWMFADTEDKAYVTEFILEVQRIMMDFMDRGDPLRGGASFRFPINTFNVSKTMVDGKVVLQDPDFIEEMSKREIYRYNILVSEGSKVASCCRLLNNFELLELGNQMNSFGGAGVSLGATRVVSINFNRVALEATSIEHYYELFESRVRSASKILEAHRQLLKELAACGMQPFIANGWLRLDRMFSILGIIGIVEAAKTLEKKFGPQEVDHMEKSLIRMNELVQELTATTGNIYNIEQIPAESMAPKLAKIDKLIFGEDNVPHMLYANQFIPLWEDAGLYERMRADGKYNQLIGAGSICHFNLGERVLPAQAKAMIEYAAQVGCEHFALNPIYSECTEGHTSFGKHETCPVCGSEIAEYYTRVVGFFVPVSGFNKTRRNWEFPKRKFVSVDEGNLHAYT